jgi:hypothetical protein
MKLMVDEVALEQTFPEFCFYHSTTAPCSNFKYVNIQIQIFVLFLKNNVQVAAH